VTAEAAVRTIHDLMTLNRRLLALMVATVSDESVSVSAVNKRRWRELRSRIEEYAVDGPVKTIILLRLPNVNYHFVVLIFLIFNFFVHIEQGEDKRRRRP